MAIAVVDIDDDRDERTVHRMAVTIGWRRMKRSRFADHLQLLLRFTGIRFLQSGGRRHDFPAPKANMASSAAFYELTD
jgi:hypothetical protein